MDNKKEQSTQKKLIKAAKKLFSRQSYDSVTTRMLATEANVGQSAIFYNFGSKLELCVAVVQDILKYHQKYYGPINDRIREASEAGELTPELALQFLQEFIRVQIDIAFDPRNRYALCLSVSGYTIPPEIATPLTDDIKNHVELPVAKLLCIYHGFDNMAKYYIISHALNTSIIAFTFVGSMDIVGSINEYDKAHDCNRVKEVLFDYCMSSVINA